jgi:hypothetical protein
LIGKYSVIVVKESLTIPKSRENSMKMIN